METNALWTFAAIFHAAFAMGSAVMVATVLRRSGLRDGRVRLILALFVVLTALFACGAADAWMHSLGGPRYTGWGIALMVLSNLAAVIGIHFYLMNLGPLASQGSWKWVWPLTAAFIMATLLYKLNRNGWDPGFLGRGEGVLRSFAGMGLGMFFYLRRPLRESGEAALTELDLDGVRPLLSDSVRDRLRLAATATFPALFAEAAGLLASRPWSPGNILLYTAAHLAMLPGIAGAVYFSTRATFFDVAIKRGALLALLTLAVSVAVHVFSLGSAAAIALTAAAFVSCLAHEQLDSILDRVVFRRPDYARSMGSISAALARSADPAATAAAELASALRAEWVRFSGSPERDAAAALTVSSPSKPWGFLSFGPRERGLRYQSEDTAFMTAAAAQLAAVLDGRETSARRQSAMEAESRALRAQINPHFLFNSLNSIAGMLSGSPRAEHAVLDLARVFRHALDSTRMESVPLGEELRFLESYLRTEKTRFEERLEFEIHCPPELRDVPVPPLLLQPLVENAIQHGISPWIEGGGIEIRAERREHRRIRITVADTGTGFDPARVTEGGVGLENVRKRVESLPDGRLSIASKPGEGARVMLEWRLDESIGG